MKTLDKQTNPRSGNTAPLHTLKAGSVFIYGGLKWVLLNAAEGGALCLAQDVLPETRSFDTENRNDWAVSTLRNWLGNKFLPELIEAGADPEAFIDLTLDLTSDDGWNEYHTDTCKIGLLSCDEYRRFRKLIPDASDWWWTCTPGSVSSKASSRNVRFVHASGAMSSSSADYINHGVRPLCNLTSSILVSFDHGEAPTEPDKVILKQDKLKKYFSEDVSPSKIEEIIIRLLEHWKESEDD